MSDIFEKFKMNGQVAVVTGAAGLLGRQFSRTLAQAGAAVVAADLNGPAVEQVAAELRAEGLQAVSAQVDVTDPRSTAAMVETALKAFGRLDVLVCSAAMDPKFDSANPVSYTHLTLPTN
jgi:2-deoxy-D-gluconate 3-dehydrogenase